ncbi:MAG: DUF5682 family protein [Cyanobacteria bacterium P01_A01_bin.17]
MAAAIHILGIRHHGPGSARSLRQTLKELQPDILLVEGPPDAEAVLEALGHPDLSPPVALLIYSPDQPQSAVYYPFSVFSPELQAIQYGLEQQIPVRMMDLPQTHQLGLQQLEKEKAERLAQAPPEATETLTPEETPTAISSPTNPSISKPKDLGTASVEPQSLGPTNLESERSDTEGHEAEHPLEQITPEVLRIRRDPLTWLAQAAGYSDSERWWEQLVEQRQSHGDIFAAILEAMQALREEYEQVFPLNPEHPHDHREALREAFMRRTIRKAKKEGFQKIAVVCGAWHGPALVDTKHSVKDDNALLKGLPKCKVKSTWIPWTYERLTWRSGYGAGIESPGWYHHLWSYPTNPATHWLTRVARLLRQQDIDASSASVIEAVRLSEALAAIRNRPTPGLDDLNEATQTVLCFGDDLPMKLIHERLIVSDRIGQVPEDTPLVPLQLDLQRLRKTLRLKLDVVVKELELDLRKENDLLRSQLFHRLNLLGIPWGKTTYSRSKGTFKEAWSIRWEPEYELALIEAGQWGNTIEAAAIAYACHQSEAAPNLPALTALLDQVLLAGLPAAIASLMTRLQAEAAVASDIAHLMSALPPLANNMRYLDLRQTDTKSVAQVVDGLIVRICIGLPGACSSLDDDAAIAMEEQVNTTHSAVKLLQNDAYLKDWQGTLTQLADQQQLHGLLAGRCCRLLLDDGCLDSEEAAQRLHLALSTANEPAQAANWIAGFLQGSGLLLIHDETIWPVLDQWVTNLSENTFTCLLPLLRRTFSEFSPAERRQMGTRVKRGNSQIAVTSTSQALDLERAQSALPLIAQLLGLQP